MISADFYYLWKDPDCKGRDPEWEVMTKKAYKEWINDPDPDRRQANRARRLIFLWGEHGTVNAMEVTPEEFKAWDVKRKQMNHAEGERIRNELSLDQLCEEGEYEFPAEPASEDDELHEWLLEAVERLPEDEKKIVKRMYLDDPKGMSDYAVARETGIPRTTVEYALRRAIGRLRADYLRTFTRLTGEN